MTDIKRTKAAVGWTNHTMHKVMMMELDLWRKYLNLKLRILDEEGHLRRNYDVTREKELFYGFTRKDNQWYHPSCTLNSWVDFTINEPSVVRLAGVPRTDKYKDKMINIIPKNIWSKFLPVLR